MGSGRTRAPRRSLTGRQRGAPHDALYSRSLAAAGSARGAGDGWLGKGTCESFSHQVRLVDIHRVFGKGRVTNLVPVPFLIERQALDQFGIDLLHVQMAQGKHPRGTIHHPVGVIGAVIDQDKGPRRPNEGLYRGS